MQMNERVRTNEAERNTDLEIGREICRADLRSVEKERALLNFKKEQFKNEMTQAW